VRFREAISALHEVVVGDLRFKKRDKSGYRAFLKQREEEEQRLRQAVMQRATREAAAELAAARPTAADRVVGESEKRELGLKFKAMHWPTPRLALLDQRAPGHRAGAAPHRLRPRGHRRPGLRLLRAFAKDESSYGCLYVDRGAFRGETGGGLGTTNVDYSPALFQHFQSLRSYRNTRLQVDPRASR
jgi:hypothetical protein